MPIKRRLPKRRLELSPGQLAFLEGKPWPQPKESYGDKPSDAFGENMRHCWLCQRKRDVDGPFGMPDRSAWARTLWAEYGAQILEERSERGDSEPHPCIERFGLPWAPAAAE
jgi:hypothetical protein